MQWIKVTIRSIWRGLHNLVKWFSLIWADRDFDYYYIYALLFHKLKSIEKTFADPSKIHQIDENRLHSLKYVSLAVKLLDSLIKDEFKTAADHEVYKQIKINWVPCEDDPDMRKAVFLNSPPREVLDEIRQREYRLRNKTRRLFFLILEKRIERWWD